MFAYSIKSLRHILAEQHSDENYAKKSYFRAIARITLMVRKFQKIESEKFIDSIEYELDKQSGLKELKISFNQNNDNFTLKNLEKFVYLIRKFNVDFDEITPIIKIDFTSMLKEGEDVNQLFFKALKYLCRNSSNSFKYIKSTNILNLIKNCKSGLVKNELVWSLGYLIELSNEKFNNQMENEIKSLIINNSEISDESKSFLLSKMETNKSVGEFNKIESQNKKTTTLINSKNNGKKNQLVVTKTIQTVKSTVKDRQSEETDHKILNLANVLKSRNRKAIIKATLENIETVGEKSGDDRSMWRSTWGECVNLYQLAAQGQPIKSDDKDNYLPDKLFGWHFFKNGNGITSRKMFTFFINRMIASSFVKISKKQELNNKALDKLFQCVENFEQFIMNKFNKANIDEICNMFVEGVFVSHDDLVELAGPDLVTNFSNVIIKKTIKTEVVKGWFVDSTKKIRLQYNKNELNEFIIKEIEKLRLDAINAIYNSALRNKKILTKNRIRIIEDCLSEDACGGFDAEIDEKFKNILIKILDTVESNADLDYEKLFKTYLKILKANSSNIQNITLAVNFISGQSRDSVRCQKLFTNEVIQDLINLLSGVLDNQIKEYIMEIMSNYLEHDTTNGLNEQLLEILIKNVIQNENSSGELTDLALLSIVLTTEKTRSLPESIKTKLIENIHCDYGDYIIMILSRIELPITNKTDLEKVSLKLDSENVVVKQDLDSKIRFEKPTESNSGCTSISFVTCKLILSSIEKKTNVSYGTIEKILSTIGESNDKQTRINASKCIYLLSEYQELDNDTLFRMENHVNNEVYDISVYMHSAYVASLAKLAARSKNPIEAIHLESLSSLIVHESLKIGDHDFADKINKNILTTLQHEAKKRKFEDENLFILMNDMLFSNEKYALEVLDILEVYTTSKFVVPLNTIMALENTLGIPDLFEKALFILQNVIRNGQQVTYKTLQIFVDNLFMSVNSRRRLRSFKLLDQARKNQDLSDDVFYKLELQKAGYGLSSRKLTENQKELLLKFLCEQTDKSNHLPIDTITTLESEIDNAMVLQIIFNVSKNKQILNYDLINKLILKFNPLSQNNNNHSLIRIFENLVKNNQTVSTDLVQKLELALENKTFQDQVLSIFVLIGQKGEKLSLNVIKKILQKITTETDIMIKQELLSSLMSIIQTNTADLSLYRIELEKILSNGLLSENLNIQKICVSTWIVLMKFVKIDKKYLDQIVKLGTDPNSDHSVREIVYMVLKSKNSGLTKDLIARIELANLSLNSNHDLLLEKIRKCLNDGSNLLKQNYNQLAQILDEDLPDIQLKTLNLLISTKHKNEVTTDLIESITILFESSNSKEIKEACVNVLEKIEKNCAALTMKAKNILRENREDSNLEFYKSEFSKSTLHSLLEEKFKLNDGQIGGLLGTMKINQSLLEIKEINTLLDIAVKINQNYYENNAVVFLIEQILLAKNFNVKALVYYNRIVKEKKYQKLEEVLESLVNRYNQTSDEKFEIYVLPLLTECIFNAIQFCALSHNCIKLLEANIDNYNEAVRSFSFKGLRLAVEDNKYESKYFDNWCTSKLEFVSTISGVKVTATSKNFFDLLQVIVSLSSIDAAVFRKHPQNIWSRELLVSDLFYHFKPHDGEQIDFYSNWLPIEEKFKYTIALNLLVLIQQRKSSFKTLCQINETLFIIKNFTYKTIKYCLSNEFIPYKTLKIKWCCDMIDDRIKNLSPEYTNKLAEIICDKFETKFIESLFRCVSSIDNKREFESLIEFCANNNLKPRDLCFRGVSVIDLKRLFEVQHICNNLQSSNEKESEKSTLFAVLFSLIKKNWKFEQLYQFIDSINNIRSNKPIQNCIDFFSIINQYNLSASKYDECLNVVIESKNATELLKNLNKLSVDNNFQSKGKVKNAATLLSELIEINSKNIKLIEYINGKLPIELAQVKSESFTSPINSIPICQWTEKHIGLWSNAVKENNHNMNTVEAIAIIRRANFLFTGFHLTDTQIVTCLISLNLDASNRGTLLQVATGEGKSTIVCILAIINALKSKVNIVTSSPVLAERDAKDKMKLFKMFKLTCSSNNDVSVYLKGPKDCYNADIVYGEVSQFQFDQLRDEYSQLGTLAGRKCQVVIVDEVDAMLIDDSSKISRLSSTAAGMDHFQSVYAFIWQKLLSIKEKFIMFNNKMYLIDGKVDFSNGKITLQYANNLGEIMEIDDLEKYISETTDISKFGKLIDTDIDEFLKKTLNEYLDNLIENKCIQVPENFMEFFKNQRPKWIKNAIEALDYQENIHYVVQEGQIKPVDYFSTGIVQSSTNWSDGLHQFLQLKHNLKMTCETFTTNFLSNIGFINAYTKIYGLTGTLGSEKARSVLKQVYKVELINVPQLRQKQYIEFPTKVILNETGWMQEICSATLLETKKDRGVLVICETIEQANIIGDRLKSKYRPSAVKLYTMNNMNQEKQVEKILPGEIIIATNLAGRGTDIQTEAIEETGGLHVIVIFMPTNQRVEDQAFGRTARQGKRGTGQMILNLMNLISFKNVNPEEVKTQRDVNESLQLDEFKNNDLQLINAKDNLFKKFCSFLNSEIRSIIRQKSGIWQKTKAQFTHIMPTVYEYNVLAAIEEQWAMFLYKLDEKTISIENSEAKFVELIESIRKDFYSGSVIKNPYYNIMIANDLIVNEKNPDKASLSFEKAAKSNGQFYGAAQVGLAWSSILKKENSKKKQLEWFNEALKILSSEMALLNSMQVVLQNKQNGFVNSELDKQINVKSTILGSYLNSVQQCQTVIKRSLRLIDVVKIDEENNTEELYFDFERNDKGEIDFEFKKNLNYKLTFNDLTTYDDTWTLDQAKQTIDAAFNKVSKHSKLKSLLSEYEDGTLPSSYESIRIRLNQISLDRLKTLLNSNKEFEDLTDEAAIAKLKSERSYLNAVTNLSSSYHVDLKIIHSDNKVEIETRKRINDAIDIIEKQKNSSLRYNITIINSNKNEINEYYLRNKNSKTMQINFIMLDNQGINEKLLLIKTNNGVNIDTVSTKKTLLPLVNNETIVSAKVCITENAKYEIFGREKLSKKVSELENDDSPFYIKIENINSNNARNIIKEMKDGIFNLQFNGVIFSELWNFLINNSVEGNVNLCFDNLNKITANEFIEVLRKEGIDFCLEFKDLNNKEAKFIIKYAHLEQEVIEISKVKNLSELFMNNALPSYEIAEFASKGIEYLFEINEKRFIPWRSIIAVAALGAVQVVIGGVLIASGFGASVGMGFISEGLSDLFTAYRAYSNRQFCWSDYAKQKAISLAISAVSAGYGKLKDAAKGASTITTEAGKEAIEQAGSQILQNGKTATEQVIKTGKNLKSLAFKYTGVKAGEAVVREGLNNGVQYLSNLSLDLVKPKISESIQNNVRNMFCTSSFMCLLRKLYAIDSLSKSKSLQGKIEKIVTEAMNPERNFLRKQWDSIGLPLLKGVLSSSEKYGSAISMGLRIYGTLQGLNELRTIINYIYEELIKKLSQLDKNTMTIALILHQNLGINKDDARCISNDLKRFKIINENDNIDHSADDSNEKSELKKRIKEYSQNQKNDKVAAYMNSFCDEYFKIELDTFSTIIKSVSDKLSDQIVRIIESQLISPWSTLAVSGLTDSISKRIQHNCLVDKDQNSDSQNNDQKKYDELKKKQENNEPLSNDDKKFMEGYGSYRTFGEQINYNARDYTIAYSQCEIAYYAKNPKPTKADEKVSEETQKLAEDVRNNKAASIGEMTLMASENGVQVKVVDDKNYERTQEEIDNGVEIVYIEKGQKDDQNVDKIGHAYYMDANGNFVDVETNPNDCFYGVMSKILENKGVNKSISDLRNETAAAIQSNSNYTNVIAAEQWVSTRYPNEANTLLFATGLKYNEKTKRLEVEDKDMTELNDSVSRRSRGRGDPEKQTEGKTNDEYFKAEVAETECSPSLEDEDLSYHHIITNNALESRIPKYNKNDVKNKTERYQNAKEEIEDYLNLTHIKEIIVKNKMYDKTVNHGEISHAAISWNQDNLVKGPKHELRSSDPGPSTDTEIKAVQQPAFQQCVNRITENLPNKKLAEIGQELRNAGGASPVNWEQNDKTKLYSVKRNQNW